MKRPRSAACALKTPLKLSTRRLIPSEALRPIWRHLGQIHVDLAPDLQTTPVSSTRPWPMKAVPLTLGVRSLGSNLELHPCASSTYARNIWCLLLPSTAIPEQEASVPPPTG